MNPRRIGISFFISFALLWLTGCSASAGQLIKLRTPIPTSVPQRTPVLETSLPQSLESTPGQTQQPLRFTFPTPQPAPVSLWRPPLYDVPWALNPLDHFYFSRPIAADEVNWPLADYRYGGVFPGTTLVHTGIDIDAPRNTPVLAAANGKVVWAGYGLFSGSSDVNDPYGIAVMLLHDFGFQGKKLYTVYAHMDEIYVQTGQLVKTGEQLGKVGITGNTSGPHLHFEVRLGSNTFFVTRNPELWLAPPQGWGVLTGRLLNSNSSLLTNQTVTIQSKTTHRKWSVISYGPSTVNSDDYYHENVVLSDLPAGDYLVSVDYLEDTLSTDLTIQPGAVTYFSFKGKYGFSHELPQPAGLDAWLFSSGLALP